MVFGYCDATACHCGHFGKGEYVVTHQNGREEIVCESCVTLHILAGIKHRPLSMGDVMAGKFKKREMPERIVGENR